MNRKWGVVIGFYLSLGILTGSALQVDDQASLPAGKVIDSVACLHDPSQTYSLYLPSAYSPDRLWPVIYAFDPGARGVLPVELLQHAAERFGYIVIGSNVSRNFEPKLSLESANAMWEDSHVRFTIDSRRVFAMGFSGGARLASALAVISRDFAGVIACGASFEAKNPPRDGRPAIFAGIVGQRDMNYPEMRSLERRLPDVQVPYRLFIFDGGHEWPSADIFLEVLAWLQIRFIRSGAVPFDGGFVQEYFQKLMTEAKQARMEGRLLESGRLYKVLLDDFDGLIDTEAARHELERLRQDAAYKKAVKRDLQLLREENEHLLRLDRRFIQIRNTPIATVAIEAAAQDWFREIDQLKRKLAKNSSADEESLYLRLIDFVCSRAAEEAVLFSRQKEYPRTALLLEIARCGRPEDPILAFYLGKTYARLQDGERAMRALDDAVGSGFRDRSALEDPVFSDLSRRPEFQALLKRLEDKPPAP